MVGAAAYVTFNPTGLMSSYTALPVQIYEWARRPQQEFQDLAAAAIIVLLVLLLILNATAIYLRQRFAKKVSGRNRAEWIRAASAFYGGESNRGT